MWQLLLKNVEFQSNTGHLVARVEGKVVELLILPFIFFTDIIAG